MYAAVEIGLCCLKILLANVATGSLTAQAVSLSNQSLSLLYPSPNAISAVFFTSSDREVFVTCLIPPVIVRTNQTLLVNTSTSIGGHLILEDSTSVLAFTIGSGVTVKADEENCGWGLTYLFAGCWNCHS